MSVFFQDHPDTLMVEKVYWVHKHAVALQYGGPEEGGWWFDVGQPTGFSMGPFTDEEAAYEQCRKLNELEYERREREEKYDYTSVLSHMSDHYSYTVEDYPDPKPFPEVRPHYE
jgi:hypothetical protein